MYCMYPHPTLNSVGEGEPNSFHIRVEEFQGEMIKIIMYNISSELLYVSIQAKPYAIVQYVLGIPILREIF